MYIFFSPALLTWEINSNVEWCLLTLTSVILTSHYDPLPTLISCVTEKLITWIVLEELFVTDSIIIYLSASGCISNLSKDTSLPVFGKVTISW